MRNQARKRLEARMRCRRGSEQAAAMERHKVVQVRRFHRGEAPRPAG